MFFTYTSPHTLKELQYEHAIQIRYFPYVLCNSIIILVILATMTLAEMVVKELIKGTLDFSLGLFLPCPFCSSLAAAVTQISTQVISLTLWPTKLLSLVHVCMCRQGCPSLSGQNCGFYLCVGCYVLVCRLGVGYIWIFLVCNVISFIMRNDLSKVSNTRVLHWSSPLPSRCPGGALAGYDHMTELRDPLTDYQGLLAYRTRNIEDRGWLDKLAEGIWTTEKKYGLYSVWIPAFYFSVYCFFSWKMKAWLGLTQPTTAL